MNIRLQTNACRTFRAGLARSVAAAHGLCAALAGASAPEEAPPSAARSKGVPDAAPGMAAVARAPLVPLDSRAGLRELSTDRPDQTESPFTVDAGHFQVEVDLVRVTIDQGTEGPGETRTRDVGTSVNLKAGLTSWMDLQVVFDPFRHLSEEDVATGARASVSGSGDLVTRFKLNLWGNDGGTTAFALMPYVKWPLPASEIRHGEWEGGLIAVLGIELPAGWSSAVMTEVDAVAEDGGGHEVEFVNSVTFSHALVGALDGYVEFYSVVGTASGGGWEGQIGAGLTYGWTENLQLDLGCNFGVTETAPDIEPFAGISFRF